MIHDVFLLLKQDNTDSVEEIYFFELDILWVIYIFFPFMIFNDSLPVHKSPPPVPFLSQVNPVQNLLICFLRINLNIQA
jgi:uncharacterized protein with PQ loop repeat